MESSNCNHLYSSLVITFPKHPLCSVHSHFTASSMLTHYIKQRLTYLQKVTMNIRAMATQHHRHEMNFFCIINNLCSFCVLRSTTILMGLMNWDERNIFVPIKLKGISHNQTATNEATWPFPFFFCVIQFSFGVYSCCCHSSIRMSDFLLHFLYANFRCKHE